MPDAVHDGRVVASALIAGDVFQSHVDRLVERGEAIGKLRANTAHSIVAPRRPFFIWVALTFPCCFYSVFPATDLSADDEPQAGARTTSRSNRDNLPAAFLMMPGGILSYSGFVARRAKVFGVGS